MSIESAIFLEESPLTYRGDQIIGLVKRLHKGPKSPKEMLSKELTTLSSNKLSQEVDDKKKETVFRKRSAETILKEGYVTGCSDIALVATAVLREMEIPTRMVDTFYQEWLNFSPSKSDRLLAKEFMEKNELTMKKLYEQSLQSSRAKHIAIRKAYDLWLEQTGNDSVPLSQLVSFLSDKGTVEGHVFLDIFLDGRWHKYEPKKGFIRGGYALGGNTYVPFAKGVDFTNMYFLTNKESSFEADSVNLQNLGPAIARMKPDNLMQQYPPLRTGHAQTK